MNKEYRIAFVGWNPFQLLHVKRLLLGIPNSVFIIEKRVDNNIDFFSDDLFKDIETQVIIVAQKDMQDLDDQYDIIITQTLFHDIHKIKKAKIVMLQYGYAKEPYNYGRWRALASLCLTYGEYASEKISPLCPTVATGNPRYDMWKNPSFHQNSISKYRQYLDQNKKTILYIPTWGDLSSFDLYIESIQRLSESYNVLIKFHHNTDYLELGKVANAKKKAIKYFGANEDILQLLSVSDIVISDYSGAIFDAVYCHRPVVLLDLADKKILNSKKIDESSLEFHQRETLGIRVSSPDKLGSTIAYITTSRLQENQELNRLRAKLFIETESTRDNVVHAIIDLMDGKFQKTPKQKEIEREVLAFYSQQSFWKIIRRKVIDIYLYLQFLRRKYA